VNVSSQQVAPAGAVLRRLPLVTLYLTERCNSRCVSCDYWRHGRADISLDSVNALLPGLTALGTRAVLISGGEPLVHPEWAEIAQALRASGLKLWLLTSGLALAKHAKNIAGLFESVTVSLDGTNRATYAAIRGVDAFDKVCAGIRAAADAGASVGVRVTVQRANYRELPGFVDLARRTGAQQVSFLAADVSNPHAFGRKDGTTPDVALNPDDLLGLEQVLNVMEREHAVDFHSGFIAESPRKLRRILQYYSALCGRAAYPQEPCNAPEFSAVIDAKRRVQPCFFIRGPAEARLDGSLEEVLNSDAMKALRRTIREGRRAECVTCVCPLWRDPDDVTGLELASPQNSSV
jgi:MoaA/NifB/PqqE/SkfB family radical SAM enzyme